MLRKALIISKNIPSIRFRGKCHEMRKSLLQSLHWPDRLSAVV
jgi:hypothetical protein